MGFITTTKTPTRSQQHVTDPTLKEGSVKQRVRQFEGFAAQEGALAMQDDAATKKAPAKGDTTAETRPMHGYGAPVEERDDAPAERMAHGYGAPQAEEDLRPEHAYGAPAEDYAPEDEAAEDEAAEEAPKDEAPKAPKDEAPKDEAPKAPGDKQGQDVPEDVAPLSKAERRAAFGDAPKRFKFDKDERVPQTQGAAREPKDAAVARMQGRLRANSQFTSDVPEKLPSGHLNPITRQPKSWNETRSKGWATVAIREEYRTRIDKKKGVVRGNDEAMKGGAKTFTVKYLLKRTAQLSEHSDALIGKNVDAAGDLKREDTVLQIGNDGVFRRAYKRADGSEGKRRVDSSKNNGNISQAVLETQEQLTRLREQLVAQQVGGDLHPALAPQVDARIAKIDAKLVKLKSEGKEGIEKYEAQKEVIGGRMIYVMNAAGDIFAGFSRFGIMHHSSFLAGGAVAGAGEVIIANGELKRISNMSGHYRPGPAYLWQVVKQLQLSGVPLDAVKVDVCGVRKPFKSATDFLAAFDPSLDPTMFECDKAIAKLNDLQNKTMEARDRAVIEGHEREQMAKHDTRQRHGS